MFIPDTYFSHMVWCWRIINNCNISSYRFMLYVLLLLSLPVRY